MPGQLLTAVLAYSALFLGLCQDCAGLHGRTRRSHHAQSSSLSSPGGVGQPGAVSQGAHNYHSNYSKNISDDINSGPTVPNLQGNLSYARATNNNNNNTSSGNDSATVKRPSFTVRGEDQGAGRGAALLCGYRLMETGGRDKLCFRATQRGFECRSGECQRARSPGGQVVANVLTNGSVLIQWERETGEKRERARGRPRGGRVQGPAVEQGSAANAPGAEATSAWGQNSPGELAGRRRSSTAAVRPGPRTRVQQGGFRLSCWWNGSYTQFECASVLLGASCRDYLLNELHENVPYRICLRPLPRQPFSGSSDHGDDPGECVEFTVSPLGMQDIVIAMTTVGGAICVMLVIICLLVAYITENIMSPATQHTHTAPHSQHTACTHSHL